MGPFSPAGRLSRGSAEPRSLLRLGQEALMKKKMTTKASWKASAAAASEAAGVAPTETEAARPYAPYRVSCAWGADCKKMSVVKLSSPTLDMSEEGRRPIGIFVKEEHWLLGAYPEEERCPGTENVAGVGRRDEVAQHCGHCFGAASAADVLAANLSACNHFPTAFRRNFAESQP